MASLTSMRVRRWLLVAGLLTMAASLARPLAAQSGADYLKDIERWRQERDAALMTDDGWRTLAGLVWLVPGSNAAGSDPSCRVPLPVGAAPAHVGTFQFKDGLTTFVPQSGVDVRINRQPASTRVLRTQPGQYDIVSAGTVSMFVIKRGTRYGVRIRDTNRTARKNFHGNQWFPIREGYRVTARFVANPAGTTVPIANVLGDVDPWPSPGYAVFTLGGHEFRLQAVLDGPGAKELFFVFRDLTTGKETYPGGRFLSAEMPVNGQVVLDFNKAHSPPCAFTPFATCPLPPKANALAVRIEAGELNPHK